MTIASVQERSCEPLAARMRRFLSPNCLNKVGHGGINGLSRLHDDIIHDRQAILQGKLANLASVFEPLGSLASLQKLVIVFLTTNRMLGLR